MLRESQGAVSTQELFGPEKSGPSYFLVMSASMAGPSCLALRARTPVPQKLPRINTQLVAVVEMEFDRVLAHAVRRSRFDGGLEHGQRPSRGFRRLSWLLVGLGPFLVAQRARTCITQERKRIMRLVAILPLNIDTCASGQVDLYRFRVCHCRHEFSIAQQNWGFCVRAWRTFPRR